MSHLGSVRALWRYPTKSLKAEDLQSAEIAFDGIPGDRGRAFIVESGGVRVGKTYRGKENNLLHLTSSEERAFEVAAARNVRVKVACDATHYFDAAPLSVIFDRWLDEASSLVGYALEPLRFRPNVFVTASTEFCGLERDFTGCPIQIGDVKLRVRGPIERCVTTTYDQTDGQSDPAVLRAIAQGRDTFLGIYCDIELPGRIRIGDVVRKLI